MSIDRFYEKDLEKDQSEKREEGIFKIEEIEIEEMAIDGICGVY